MVEGLALPTSDHEVPDLNPTVGGIQAMTVLLFNDILMLPIASVDI